MAGGIAHDFNNILSGIFGYAQLTAMNLDKPDKAKEHIEQINKGAKRATDLIQQILTFSRQTEHEKRPVKFYLIVKEALKFLRSSIPSNISIIEDISANTKVKADPTQLHQIVMNLCTNAYHAMKDIGGTLSVSLTEMTIQKENLNLNPGIKPGKYLKLEISDTGFGMTPGIQNKIFEPYFTTKKVSEGTGLGLSVVLGIVQEHKGYIKVFSKVNEGTTFHVYLPEYKDNIISDFDIEENLNIKGGSETIMIVDDDKSILSSTSEMLEDYGYHTSCFLDVSAAFKEFKKNPHAFDLLITDMTMPNMTGDQFSKKVLGIRNDIPIILCSGYSDKMSEKKALVLGIKKYLQKPIESGIFLISIRKILDDRKLN